MFNNPTGQLKKENVNQVGQAFADAEKKGQGISMTAGALDEIESAASEDPISCPQHPTSPNFSCTCNAGGTLDINAGSYSSESVSVDYTYHQCAITSDDCTIVYNGTGYVVSSQSGQDYFISYRGTVKDCDGQTFNIDISYYYDGSKVWVLVEVGGETFVVSGNWSEESYDFYVKDKDGEWHCQGTSAGGSCTGPGGQTINL
jgi:hypothetical protein